jgi:hypothetical protein
MLGLEPLLGNHILHLKRYFFGWYVPITYVATFPANFVFDRYPIYGYDPTSAFFRSYVSFFDSRFYVDF